MKIVSIKGYEIFDSRGWPTIMCAITLDDGSVSTGSAPAGLSCSAHEAREVRDGGKRLWGHGVLKGISLLHEIIAPEFIGKEPHGVDADVRMIELDNTSDLSYLGANTLLAVSMAMFRAQAHAHQIELYELLGYLYGAESVALPFPFFNVLNGGLHANNKLLFQEFMVIPVGALNFRDSMQVGVTVYHELKNTLLRKGYSTAVGDEGGFGDGIPSDMHALELLTEVLEKVASHEEHRCVIALDAAATQLYDSLSRTYRWHTGQLKTDQMIKVYESLIEEFPIYSLEDPLSQDDWAGWQSMKKALTDKVQLVADDLCASNPELIAQALELDCINSTIIKPHQLGTITQTMQAMKFCQEQQLNTILSHRSGETEDSFLADLAVGLSSGQIKSGGLRGSERLAKYNRLLYIEDELIQQT